MGKARQAAVGTISRGTMPGATTCALHRDSGSLDTREGMEASVDHVFTRTGLYYETPAREVSLAF